MQEGLWDRESIALGNAELTIFAIQCGLDELSQIGSSTAQKSGQRLDYVNQTHLVLVSGQLGQQKRTMPPSSDT